MQPDDSLDVFQATVGVYDSNGAVIESNNQNYGIILLLDPTGSISGTVSKSTTSGVAVFGNLRILSNGSFKIQATSTGLASVETSVMTITNYVHTITLASSNVSPSVNFDFTLTATLKGEDLQPFLNSCALTLSETTGIAIIGSTSATTSTGSADFVIAFATAGTKSLSVSCPASGLNPIKTGTLSISISSLILRINSINPTVITIQPSTSLTEFSISISIFDHSGNNKETQRGPYSITLSASPSGTVVGTWSGTTVSGDLTLQSLRILSENSYILTASSSNIVSAASSSISIVKQLYSMTITSSEATPSAHFDFVLTVDSTSEDNSVYAHSCQIDLSGTDLAGSLSKTSLTGQITFTVRVTLSGSHTITAKSLATASRGEVSTSITLNILANVLRLSTFQLTVFPK
jgi:hypothetical protein